MVPSDLSSGLLDQAIIDHQAGRLVQAEAAYRRILEACPTHPRPASISACCFCSSKGRARPSRSSPGR